MNTASTRAGVWLRGLNTTVLPLASATEPGFSHEGTGREGRGPQVQMFSLQGDPLRRRSGQGYFAFPSSQLLGLASDKQNILRGKKYRVHERPQFQASWLLP